MPSDIRSIGIKAMLGYATLAFAILGLVLETPKAFIAPVGIVSIFTVLTVAIGLIAFLRRTTPPDYPSYDHSANYTR